jgi:hypothetical protein
MCSFVWSHRGCAAGAGYVVNINEVGGEYSGILFGVSNTIGTLPGVIAPYIVGILTTHVNGDGGDQNSKRIVAVLC